MTLWRFLPPDRLGQKLRELMKERGWTQTQLADMLGMPGSQSQVSLWVRGKVRPKVETLEKLAALGGVGLDYFADGEGPEDLEDVDDPVEEVIRSVSHPAAVRAYGRGNLDVESVMTAVMEHGREEGWTDEQLARVSRLREELSQRAEALKHARSAGNRAESSRPR
jgi:transcriptional regulator with XRE-family HTH domain